MSLIVSLGRERAKVIRLNWGCLVFMHLSTHVGQAQPMGT